MLWFEKTLKHIPSLSQLWEPTIVNLAHAYRKLKYVLKFVGMAVILTFFCCFLPYLGTSGCMIGVLLSRVFLVLEMKYLSYPQIERLFL